LISDREVDRFTKGAKEANIRLVRWRRSGGASRVWHGVETGEEGPLDLRGLWRVAYHYGWSSTAVRAVVVLLAIFIPGVSVIPAVLIYILLGYLLPEAEEF
jgi:hypothetical protein